ncbi:hypothetical protein BHE74_00039123 [Ensete ventricosum]|uniref:Uncharacterized protein n=1 Tax=Ensete ventricosum TaxID=4639 RepID=A0A426Y1Q7_ENSVE|nr:hypothetical protein B296_00055108 [Ensete ventricosum]RWW27159.1 hypothetical protein GW17_00008430 [Ensete ventricosum]RWW54309.1 hypothetical protein BHE74_00039123 [Ensete ventricosum]
MKTCEETTWEPREKNEKKTIGLVLSTVEECRRPRPADGLTLFLARRFARCMRPRRRGRHRIATDGRRNSNSRGSVGLRAVAADLHHCMCVPPTPSHPETTFIHVVFVLVIYHHQKL